MQETTRACEEQIPHKWLLRYGFGTSTPIMSIYRRLIVFGIGDGFFNMSAMLEAPPNPTTAPAKLGL